MWVNYSSARGTMSGTRRSPRSSLAGYLFVETCSNFSFSLLNLLDARSKLCRPDKEGQSAAGERYDSSVSVLPCYA